MREIDCEARRIVEEQYTRVSPLLDGQQDVLRRAAALLLENEPIAGEDLKAFIGQVPGRGMSQSTQSPQGGAIHLLKDLS